MNILEYQIKCCWKWNDLSKYYRKYFTELPTAVQKIPSENQQSRPEH